MRVDASKNVAAIAINQQRNVPILAICYTAKRGNEFMRVLGVYISGKMDVLHSPISWLLL